jgi:phosphatidylserine decarboxylase
MDPWLQTIEKLKSLICERQDLRTALDISISKAGFNDVRNIEDYYSFLAGLLSEIPTQRLMGPASDKFHYLISQSPGDLLKKDPSFREWLVTFSRSYGSFLNTTTSALQLDTFINDPSYQISDYDPGPSGWLTFNQFFSRSVKPGKRPIDEIDNPYIIVSATDSTFLGTWPIDEKAAVTAKGVVYPISDLINDSNLANEFKNGVFTHSWLNTTDYHRFHVPVGGKIIESRKIPGDVIVNTVKGSDGEFITQDEVGFQFKQTRGLIIIETSFGLVAVLPIGMGHVSSVTLTAETGVTLVKGQEFGYFAYGGSDMVILFQQKNIEFSALENKHYKQGQRIARFID